MSSMSEQNTPAGPEQRPVPVKLAGNRTAVMADMLRRIVPPAVEDDGVSKLDVCQFNSSL